MDRQIQQALAHDRLIDITTTGRKTGQERRIEIWFHRWNGRYFITGTPGRRSWYANLKTQPHFTFHLKESAQADLPAQARVINDTAERKELLAGIMTNLGRVEELDKWVQHSPLVEVTFD